MISLSKRRQPEVELMWSMTLMATSVKGQTEWRFSGVEVQGR